MSFDETSESPYLRNLYERLCNAERDEETGILKAEVVRLERGAKR